MIEMSVRHQNRVRFCREMTQSIVDPRGVWLNARTKRNAQKIHAREVRIDKQGVALEFELVTVRAKISHAHTVARCARRIGNNQLRIWRQVHAESLRRKSPRKRKNHTRPPDNARCHAMWKTKMAY